MGTQKEVLKHRELVAMLQNRDRIGAITNRIQVREITNMEDHKSNFRKLTEMTDKIAREELGEYYIISATRMDNLLCCLEQGAAEITRLSTENLSRRTELLSANAKISRLQQELEEAKGYMGA